MSEIEETVEILACSLCGGDRFHEELQSRKWTLRRCDSCGLVFTSPRPSDEVLADYYRDSYYQKGRASYQQLQAEAPAFGDHALARRMRRMTGQRRSRGLRSVDVGCGGGALVEAFAGAGFEACGLEPNRAVAESGVALGRAISQVPIDALGQGTFDVVTCMHVLEHIPDPMTFVRCLVKCLAPGGLLVIEVPDYGSKAAKRDGARWKALYPGLHLHQFEEATMGKLLVKCGMEIVETRRLGGSVGGSVASPRLPDALKTQKPTLRSRLWALRRLAHASPKLRGWCRDFYWNTLRNGEYLQVVAKHADSQ